MHQNKPPGQVVTIKPIAIGSSCPAYLLCGIGVLVSYVDILSNGFLNVKFYLTPTLSLKQEEGIIFDNAGNCDIIIFNK